MRIVLKIGWWSRIGVILVMSLAMNSNALGLVTWSNTGTGSWHAGGAGGNWGGLPVPTSADHAVIANGGTATISEDAVAKYMSLGNAVTTGGSGFIAMDASGYSLSVKEQIRICYTESTTGGFTLDAGNVTTKALGVGFKGTGDFTQNGGSVDVSQTVLLGGATLASTGVVSPGVGTYSISDGILSCTGIATGGGLRVGHGGAGAFNQSGGLVSIRRTAANSYTSGGIHIGDVSGGGDASYTMTGGTLDGGVDGGTCIRVGCNKVANATFTLSGGDVYASMMSVYNGSGGSAVFDFNSGSLYANALLQTSTVQDGTVTWSGGTLHPLTGDLHVYNQEPAVFELDGDGATFDSTGADGVAYDIYVDIAISGDYGLTKTGSGSLFMDNFNTYTGDTLIEAGTLSISEAYLADTSAVSIASGAFLDLAFSGNDAIQSLYLDGSPMAPGVYNAGNCAYITGSGGLHVVPEPGTLALLVTWAFGMLAYAWRKRKQ